MFVGFQIEICDFMAVQLTNILFEGLLLSVAWFRAL